MSGYTNLLYRGCQVAPSLPAPYSPSSGGWLHRPSCHLQPPRFPAVHVPNPAARPARFPSPATRPARLPSPALPVKFPRSGRRPPSSLWSCSGRRHVLEPLLLPYQAPVVARPAPWRRPPGRLSGRCPPSGYWSCLGWTHVAEAHPPPLPSAGGRPACCVVSWGSPGREVLCE
jgi:hypothetical protein